jgi:hypothetical protein
VIFGHRARSRVPGTARGQERLKDRSQRATAGSRAATRPLCSFLGQQGDQGLVRDAPAAGTDRERVGTAVSAGASSRVYTEQLQPRERILLYTDGVTDGRAADGRVFDCHASATSSSATAPKVCPRLKRYAAPTGRSAITGRDVYATMRRSPGWNGCPNIPKASSPPDDGAVRIAIRLLARDMAGPEASSGPRTRMAT